VVHRSSDCGVEGRATPHAWWSAALLGVGNHHGADAAGGFPPGPTPDGTQLVAPACVGTPGWVVGWDDDARSPALYRLSVSGRDYQPSRTAVFPLPAGSPHGRG